MEIKQETCFTDSNGEIIYLFTLSNARGTEVQITNYGATITSFIIAMPDGSQNDIVLGFENIKDYQSPAYLAQYPWFGAAVGRYANRIGNAEFMLNGRKYELAKNNGRHQLHGGPEGFDRKAWLIKEKGKTPFPFLELEYKSKDGEEGYPGNLMVILRFELNDNDELIHSYKATTDQPTPVNLTHHSYFNLHNGNGTIMDHELFIPASRILEQDAELVATGRIIGVENSPYDFRQFQNIGEGHEKIPEYDKTFLVDEESNGLKLMAEARYPGNRTRLRVMSNDKVLHFYSGKWTPLVEGKKGTYYGPYSGFCLETHAYPNAVNIPHFPNSILEPGETYEQTTVYKVFTGENY